MKSKEIKKYEKRLQICNYIEDAFSQYFNENNIEVKKNVVLPINKNYIINLEIIKNDKLIQIQDVVFDDLFNLLHNGSSIKTDYIRKLLNGAVKYIDNNENIFGIVILFMLIFAGILGLLCSANIDNILNHILL